MPLVLGCLEVGTRSCTKAMVLLAQKCRATSRSKTNFGFPKWRRPHVPPPKTMLRVLSWRGRKFVLGKRGTNFATSIVFGRVVRRIRSQVFRGGHTVKLTSSFPNGATTPTKTMLKVLSLRDRKMFLAKRGTDFAPSFVWVCMVEGGPAHPKLSFGGGCSLFYVPPGNCESTRHTLCTISQRLY